MEAIRTSYARHTLKGEGCKDLPAAVWVNEETGDVQYEAAFELSPAEIADLLNGGKVYLYTLTRGGYPPVFLTTRSEAIGSLENDREQAEEARRQSPEARAAMSRIAAELESRLLDYYTPEEQDEQRRLNRCIAALFSALLARPNPRARATDVIDWLVHVVETHPYFEGDWKKGKA